MPKTDLKSQANAEPPHGGRPRAAFFGSFGCRLYILLLLIIVAALAITLHEDFNEQRLEKTRVRDNALALACLAAANQENLLSSPLDPFRLSPAIERIEIPEGGSISVFDRHGVVLACHPRRESVIGKPFLDQTTIRTILAEKGGAFENQGSDHVSRFYAIKSVACRGEPVQFVAVEVPLAVLFARANELLFGRILLLAGVAAAMLIVVHHYAKRFLLLPIKKLAAVAQRLAAGELTARAGAITAAWELAQLGGVLDTMAERVQARTEELIQANKALRTEIAERKRAEEEVRQQKEEKRKLEEHILRSQRMEGIGALAGGIAHDLNNALVPIVVGSHMLQQGGDNYADRQQVLQTIETSGRRCTALLKQMLTFARGSREESSSVPLRHLIQEMAAIARNTFPKNIEVQRHFPKDLWNVQGNATELHQVLLNLCVNARDAMSHGGLLVITAENSERSEHLPANASPGSYVAMTVSDTGIGIAPE
ncbi:MAG TPA: HAMP domain-containing protein, partial [Candidatus Dormibacteraeota bacterium]|nr:HAMP domain-containing protein [Candidatus Dormibacteraeota bacterium]